MGTDPGEGPNLTVAGWLPSGPATVTEDLTQQVISSLTGSAVSRMGGWMLARLNKIARLELPLTCVPRQKCPLGPALQQHS